LKLIKDIIKSVFIMIEKILPSQRGIWLRALYIVLATMLGVLLAKYGRFILLDFFGVKYNLGNKLEDSLYFFLFLAGLPVFLTLWTFRTYDNKLREFFEAVRLLGDEKNKRIGIMLLMYLKRTKKVFIKEIDAITSNSFFTKVNLSNLDLRKANFSKSDLREVFLIGTNLEGAVLKEIILFGAHLVGTNLKGADLTEANLVKAHLKGADLTEANLVKAHLKGANLTGANMVKANLSDVDLRDIDLKDVDLKGAIYNSKTLLDFDPESRGMIKSKDK